ncbi:hypothetical protein JCM24511_06410 [Saitozyma sp. JCM 24511]|nr:hypothetical protein JCM24511_06410 [Saitozyma sp. JCM 24511]
MSDSKSKTKTLVVFGATGNVGSALINNLAHTYQALVKNNTATSTVFSIVAFVRDPNAGSAKRLSALPGVRIVHVQNYMDEPAKAFEAAGLGKGEVYGVFSNQGYVDPKVEEAQGKAIIDAAAALGCSHFVYNSVDMGRSSPPGPAFTSKYNVEEHLKSIFSSPTNASTGFGWTIIRPSQFMDNLLPSSAFMFKLSRTMLLRRTFYTHPERKHQMVSTRDIGRVSARAFEKPEEFKSRTICLSGDEFTMPELEAIYKEEMGEPIKETFATLVSIVKLLVPFLRQMAEAQDQEGFSADIPLLRKEFPDLEDLRAFLRRYRAERGL